jgi:hypothetical protein
MQKHWAALGAAGVMAFVGTMIASPNSAHAQMDPCVTAGGGTVCRTNALPQGTIGGALLGMEAVMLIEGAAGVRNGWIMLGTGLAGGIAGGVGGYFLDQALDAMGTPQGMTAISTGLMVVGFGLVIPTAIVFTGATMYRPPEANQQQEDDSQGVALEESGASNAGGAGSGGTTPASGTAPASGSTSTGPTTGRTTSSWWRLRRPTRLVSARSASAHGPAMMRPSLFNLSSQGWTIGVPGVGMTTRQAVDGQSSSNEWRINLLSGTF